MESFVVDILDIRRYVSVQLKISRYDCQFTPTSYMLIVDVDIVGGDWRLESVCLTVSY